MAIYFYKTAEKPYGCFSNFARYGIDLDGNWWPTVEHYFQAQKFHGTPYAETIRTAETPREAAKRGRSRNHPLRPDWEKVKDEVMLVAVQRKFEQHESIRQILMQTGDEEIIEDAPNDYYWGIGSGGTGQNKLGQILMQVRARIRTGK